MMIQIYLIFFFVNLCLSRKPPPLDPLGFQDFYEPKVERMLKRLDVPVNSRYHTKKVVASLEKGFLYGHGTTYNIKFIIQPLACLKSEISVAHIDSCYPKVCVCIYLYDYC